MFRPSHSFFLKYFVEQAIWGLSVLSRYAPSHFSQVNRYMSGLIRILLSTLNVLLGTFLRAS